MKGKQPKAVDMNPYPVLAFISEIKGNSLTTKQKEK